jgi:CheY-like chemotaxis protein
MQTSLSQGWQAVRRGLQSISLTLQYLKQAPADSSSLQLLSAQECVHKAVNEFAYESPEQRASVHVQAHADFTFRGDETTVVLILFNLLKNALYYLPLAPQATITLRVEAGATNRIVVHDTGPGIAPALRGRLFEEFQTAGKAEGTGLGLAFCRRAMRSFGGDIECESEAGRFTTFTLTFPHANQAAASSATSPPPTRDRALSGRRVLVVDDSALNRAFARARLIGLGAHVTEATHADEALRMVREGAPADAILMDMNMPGMSGIDATRALRALHGPAARIPVMILTADPTPSARQKALAAGADAFLVKPLESELLREELCRLIA